MSNQQFPDISVGDFATDILKSMAKDPKALLPALKESSVGNAKAPDVSHINVSDDFVSLVTEGKKVQKISTTKYRSKKKGANNRRASTNIPVGGQANINALATGTQAN